MMMQPVNTADSSLHQVTTSYYD